MTNTEVNKIQELLEKYFEGGTDSGEEKILRQYFTGHEHIPDDLEYARVMFGYFSEASQETSGTRFTATPREDEGRMGRQEHTAAIRIIKRRRFTRAFAYAASAAAVIAAAIILSVNFRESTDISDTVYCYVNGEPVTDYETALTYTQEAMRYFSDNLSEPLGYLETISEFNTPLRITRLLSGEADILTKDKTLP